MRDLHILTHMTRLLRFNSFNSVIIPTELVCKVNAILYTFSFLAFYYSWTNDAYDQTLTCIPSLRASSLGVFWGVGGGGWVAGEEGELAWMSQSFEYLQAIVSPPNLKGVVSSSF